MEYLGGFFFFLWRWDWLGYGTGTETETESGMDAWIPDTPICLKARHDDYYIYPWIRRCTELVQMTSSGSQLNYDFDVFYDSQVLSHSILFSLSFS